VNYCQSFALQTQNNPVRIVAMRTIILCLCFSIFLAPVSSEEGKKESFLQYMMRILKGPQAPKRKPYQGNLGDGVKNAFESREWYESLSAEQKRGVAIFRQSGKYYDKDPKKAYRLVEKALELFPGYKTAQEDYLALKYQLGLPGGVPPVKTEESKDQFYMSSLKKYWEEEPEKALTLIDRAIEIKSTPERLEDREVLRKRVAWNLMKQADEMNPPVVAKVMELVSRAKKLQPQDAAIIKEYALTRQNYSHWLASEAQSYMETNPVKSLEMLEKSLELREDKNVLIEKYEAQQKVREFLHQRAEKSWESDPVQAYKDLKRIAKMDPKDQGILDDIRILGVEAGNQLHQEGISWISKNPKKALEIMEQAVEANPSNPNIKEDYEALKSDLQNNK